MREVPKDYWRDELMAALIQNRSRMGRGCGSKYWKSVVSTIEEFASRNEPV